MFRVTMRGIGTDQNIALLRPRRHTGGGTDTLHINNHGRNLGVVSQTQQFVHQRNARTRRGGERTSSVPRSPDHHPDSGQFVFRLQEHVVAGTRFRVFAVLVGEGLEVIHYRRGRGNRIPGRHGRAAINAAQSRRGVAINQDLVFIAIHRLQMERQREGVVFPNVIAAQLQSLHIRFPHALFLAVLLFQKLRHHVGINIEQLNQSPRSGDVLHQNPLARFLEVLVAEAGQRHANERDIITVQVVIQRPARIVQHVAAGPNFLDVPRIRLRVHRHHQVVIESPCRVPFRVHADLVPGGKALNIRGEQVLAGHGHAHPEDGLHDEAVGAGGPCSVDVRQFDCKIVDAATHG